MKLISVATTLTRCAAFFVLLIVCDGKRLAGQNNLQGPTVPANEQPEKDLRNLVDGCSVR